MKIMFNNFQANKRNWVFRLNFTFIFQGIMPFLDSAMVLCVSQMAVFFHKGFKFKRYLGFEIFKEGIIFMVKPRVIRLFL